MESQTHFLIKNEISKIVNSVSNNSVQKISRPRVVSRFEKINDEVPYLTEEKIEDAFLSSSPTSKTIKLLRWLTIKENLDLACEYYNAHPDKFEDCKYILTSNKIDFNTLVKKLIQKHEQAISNGE